MPRPRTQRTSPRRVAGSAAAPEPTGQETGQAIKGDGIAAGVQIEWLDPKVITWPEGRITSEYDEEKAAALRNSMVELGQQDAVGVVQLEDGTYEGSAGYNRCMAAVESGAQTILCVVRSGTHRDVVKSNLATSLNQSKANVMDEVEGIAHAFYDEGFLMEELVLTTGKSESWIEERLLIHNASPVVQQALRDSMIAIGHAVRLANLDGHPAQGETLHLQLQHGWSLRELEDYMRGPGQDGAASGGGDGQRSPRTRQQQPVACKYCDLEQVPSEMSKINVCNDCAGKLKINPAPADGVVVPVEWLREAEGVLAGTQAGAGLAERIGVLLESADVGS